MIMMARKVDARISERRASRSPKSRRGRRRNPFWQFALSQVLEDLPVKFLDDDPLPPPLPTRADRESPRR